MTLLPWQSTLPGGPAERPYDQWHDEIFRWFDYWLKGIDTGIMDEPPVKIWIRGRGMDGVGRVAAPQQDELDQALPT